MNGNNGHVLEKLEAVLLITKHLRRLLPFLLALRQVPAQAPQRVELLQSIADDIASDPSMASDWYKAMSLFSGEDLSSSSVAELLLRSVNLFRDGGLNELWSAAFSIGLLDEKSLQEWVLLEGLAYGRTGSRGRTG